MRDYIATYHTSVWVRDPEDGDYVRAGSSEHRFSAGNDVLALAIAEDYVTKFPETADIELKSLVEVIVRNVELRSRQTEIAPA